MDIYASLLRHGRAYQPIDLPYAPHTWPQARFE
jgi:hypothetical protein